jgi:hypothetical protein
MLTVVVAAVVVAGIDVSNGASRVQSDVERASAAALAYLGGGEVTGVEVGDEDGAYEIEVTLGGTEIDVHLDPDFNVISTEADGDDEDGTEEDDGSDPEDD